MDKPIEEGDPPLFIKIFVPSEEDPIIEQIRDLLGQFVEQRSVRFVLGTVKLGETTQC